MSQAEELLNEMSEEEISAYTIDPDTEEHIVIDKDRKITVPKALKRIAVQYDHMIETVTFDCPRYWDNNDLYTMYIYVNYMTSSSKKGRFLVKNIRVDDIDENIIHFEWTISKEMTMTDGAISFIVCAVQTDSEGNEELHWNTEINKEMTISKGLEASDIAPVEYPDIINDLLFRMDHILEADNNILDTSLTQNGLAADAGVTRCCS